MKDNTYIEIAKVLAKESKCVSKQVGAVIVKDGRIISTGINGTPKGHTNCCELHSNEVRPDIWKNGELTKKGREEHHEFSKTNEIHAELNAILFAARNGVSIEGSTMYVTLSPCADCAKALAQSGIVRVVYEEIYDKNPTDWDKILIDIKIEQLRV